MDIDNTQYGYIFELRGALRRHNVTHYAFRPEVIRDEIIFKDLSTVKSSIYVTDRFVQAVIDANLTGFIFRRMQRIFPGMRPGTTGTLSIQESRC